MNIVEINNIAKQTKRQHPEFIMQGVQVLAYALALLSVAK